MAQVTQSASNSAELHPLAGLNATCLVEVVFLYDSVGHQLFFIHID